MRVKAGMMQNNIKIAVTGGIGSGKSSVCQIIRSAGFPVLSCDEIYAELCADKKFLERLCEEFGNILLADGSLNRKKLSQIAFNDEAALKKLNNLTHPAIMEELFLRASGHKLCFCEVPLLFEGGYQGCFDGAIVILRAEEERIKSVSLRDKISAQAAILRIKNQFNYENADFTQYYVIHNDGDLTDLRQKTLEIIEKIKVKFINKKN